LVYWSSAKRGAVVYVWVENDYLRAFFFDRKAGRFLTTGCQAPAPAWAVGKAKALELNSGMTGGMLSISASGDRGGMVWAIIPFSADANPKTVPGILKTYDADDLTRELWNSHQDLERDDLGNLAKFTAPTIANGKVYVATFSRHVSVYGLNPPSVGSALANLLKNGGFETPGADAWSADAGWAVSRRDERSLFVSGFLSRHGLWRSVFDRRPGCGCVSGPDRCRGGYIPARRVLRDQRGERLRRRLEPGWGRTGDRRERQRGVERRVVEPHTATALFWLMAHKGSDQRQYRAPR
jgi:hypothetical protein